MDGVEILATQREGGFFLGVIFILILAFVAGACFFILINAKSEKTHKLLALWAMVICLLFIVIIGYFVENLKTYYKVAISDTVRLNEFHERYKIIKQDGKIYMVEERGS